jgi:hypothetical protein
VFLKYCLFTARQFRNAKINMAGVTISNLLENIRTYYLCGYNGPPLTIDNAQEAGSQHALRQSGTPSSVCIQDGIKILSYIQLKHGAAINRLVAHHRLVNDESLVAFTNNTNNQLRFSETLYLFCDNMIGVLALFLKGYEK